MRHTFDIGAAALMGKMQKPFHIGATAPLDEKELPFDIAAAVLKAGRQTGLDRISNTQTF